MTEGYTDLELVQRALAGDRGCLSELSVAVQDKVFPYINRVLLHEDRARELTQETLLAVLNALGSLREPDRFWPWTFRIATNQIRLHFRTRRGQRTVSMSAVEGTVAEPACHRHEEGLIGVARQELAELTRAAMAELGRRQRMVLALRFYEDMPYAEVARVMGCTELVARMTLFRAKSALLRKLRRRGVRDASVLSALVAFGELTSGSTAAAATVKVSAAALKGIGLPVLASAKAKAAAAAVAAVIAIAGLMTVMPSGLQTSGGRPGTAGFVGTAQSAPVAAATGLPIWIHSQHHGLAFYSDQHPKESWYYYPEGVDGPCFYTMQPGDEEAWQHVDALLTGPDFNYRISAQSSTVRVRSARLFCQLLHTRILPTDDAGFCEFVADHEDWGSHAMVDTDSFTFERDPGTGFVVGGLDLRELGAPVPFTFTYLPGVSQEPFSFMPPEGWEWIDERSDMHRRGWTLFRVHGHAGSEAVSGSGQLPFTWSASFERPMWITLNVGSRLMVMADPWRGVLRSGAGGIAAEFEGGELLRGLSRPWQGLHTLDTIRRDAARSRISFRTSVIEPDKLVEIVLVDENDSIRRMASYLVDLPNDLLMEAHFWSGPEETFDEPLVSLLFEYLQEVEELDEEFYYPEQPAAAGLGQDGLPGPFWPLMLLDQS